MVNAKRGPFDRAELSPIEMVRAFHIIRANIIVKELSAFPRHDDLSAAHDRMFFDANDLQMAVIFVSHRWHSPSHPDPEGEQLSAVKIFLSWAKKWCDPTAFWASQVGLFQLFSRNSASTGQDILKATLAHFSSCLFPWKLQSVRWKGRRQPGRFAESRRRRPQQDWCLVRLHIDAASSGKSRSASGCVGADT